MEKLIEFIKTDKNLTTKMDKICFAVGYSHSSKYMNEAEDITKDQLINVLEKIIFNEI